MRFTMLLAAGAITACGGGASHAGGAPLDHHASFESPPTVAPADKPVVQPAAPTGPADTASFPLVASEPHIPIVQGLVLMSALHVEEGDRENTVMVGNVSPEGVTFSWKYRERHADGSVEQDAFERFDRAEDLAAAPRLNSVFRQGEGPERAPGYTAMTISRASYNQLRLEGQTPYTIKAFPRGTPGGALGIPPALVTLKGTLKRVSTRPESLSVLVNGRRSSLATLHVRGSFAFQDDHRDVDYWLLADSAFPLILKGQAGTKLFQMVRIEFPDTAHPAAQVVEEELSTECRAELPGIYFAFASAELQPASDAALASVAGLLAHHPDWSIAIEGHTDSIGNPAANQKLSVDRAAAVRTALIDTYHVPGTRLRSTGFGATRPLETNATIEGRARNRRVELVRACAGRRP